MSRDAARPEPAGSIDREGRHARTGGIVLAGGRSSRLAASGLSLPGGKAGLALGGRSLLERVVTAVAEVAGRVVVVAAPGQPLPELAGAVAVVRDSRPGTGPLAAIADGLAALRSLGGIERVVVASCDVPLVRPALLARLLDRLGAVGETPRWVVPEVEGHLQVLLSAMRPDLAGAIDAWIGEGRRDPRSLVERLRGSPSGAADVVPGEALRDADPELASFRDLDTVEDLEKLRRFLDPRGES